jgi:hypothetical protein
MDPPGYQLSQLAGPTIHHATATHMAIAALFATTLPDMRKVIRCCLVPSLPIRLSTRTTMTIVQLQLLAMPLPSFQSVSFRMKPVASSCDFGLSSCHSVAPATQHQPLLYSMLTSVPPNQSLPPASADAALFQPSRNKPCRRRSASVILHRSPPTPLRFSRRAPNLANAASLQPSRYEPCQRRSASAVALRTLPTPQCFSRPAPLRFDLPPWSSSS